VVNASTDFFNVLLLDGCCNRDRLPARSIIDQSSLLGCGFTRPMDNRQ
jgi:hypothetical protein